MYVPAVRERVAVSDRHGAFIVIGVNREGEVADLVALIGSSFIDEDVPFWKIRPYPETSKDAD